MCNSLSSISCSFHPPIDASSIVDIVEDAVYTSKDTSHHILFNLRQGQSSARVIHEFYRRLNKDSIAIEDIRYDTRYPTLELVFTCNNLNSRLGHHLKHWTNQINKAS